MKKIPLFFPAVLLLAVQLPLFAQTPSADELLRLAERVMFPDIYHAEMTVTTVKPGQRETSMGMEVYYKEGSGSFIEMTAPARSRGIRLLEKESSLYMYNPKSNSSRPLRLSPEQSFQGTVFSNSDVSDPRYTNNYQARLEGTESFDHPDLGRVECRILTAEARTREAPYGKIKIWIDSRELRPLRFDYYAKSGLLFKSMVLKDYRQLAGKMRPAVMRMDSFELEGSWSEVRIDSLESLTDLPDSRFTTSALTR